MYFTFLPGSSRFWGTGVVLLGVAMLAIGNEASAADLDPKLDAVVERLIPAQSVRIQTDDFRMLRGHFVQARGDSLLLASLTENGNKKQGEAISLGEIDRLWITENHGLGRGLLWAGGTLLIGGYLTLSAGEKPIGEGALMLWMGGTLAATFYALHKGASGSKETQVYSRLR